jgi:predicted alpha/beta-fold hydrolase
MRMPLVAPSTYRPPRGWSNGHLQSIFPALFRRVPVHNYRRERIDTPDGDFLDVDWLGSGSDRLAILSHGLEGSSDSTYIRGMARMLTRQGWDALAWNCRGCSGVPNRLLRLYHSGSSDDLDAVVRHALRSDRYRSIALIGFSLGGNITLKWVGEQGDRIDPRVVKAVAFSVPCDLAGSSIKMGSLSNRVYMWRFMRCLRVKVRWKMELYPGRIHDRGLDRMWTFKQFDDAYTAPLHGFENAEDYWRRSSSRDFFDAIRIPALLVNARNDPFLSDTCFPEEQARGHQWFHFEAPAFGGHVGFMSFNGDGTYWLERRAAEFLQDRNSLS